MQAGINPQRSQSTSTSAPSGFFGKSQGSMPGDLLESARIRVRTACLVVGGLWFYVLLMDKIVYPLFGRPPLTNGNTWAPEQSVLIIVGVILSIVAEWWVKRMRANP